MNQESKSSSSGMGLGSVLFVVFLVLKLTDHIDWSWWWVTSPLWISALLGVLVVLLVFLIQFIHDRKQERKHLAYMRRWEKSKKTSKKNK